jgi:serpin B
MGHSVTASGPFDRHSEGTDAVSNIPDVHGRYEKPLRRQAAKAAAAGIFMALTMTTSLVGIAAAAADPAFDLLRALAQRESGGNVVISPLSVGSALALLSEGAAGETRREIGQLVAPDLRAALQRFRTASAASRQASAGTSVDFGSAIWSTPRLKFSDGFSALAQRDYSAITLSCEASAAPARLNEWIDKTTRGLIKSILDVPPDPNGVVLANGVVFVGKWLEPFDPSLTRPAPFTGVDGKARAVPLMNRAGLFRYAAVADGQLVDLRYDDQRYSLRLFLPGEGEGLAKWLAGASSSSWTALGKELQEAPGELILPKLDLAFSTELVPVLRQLGIQAAFRPDADFSPMTAEKAQLFVSSVVHKTVVKVDEVGTKAAASTVIQMPGMAAAPRPPFKMVVNRPFAFAIHEVAHDDLLFLGIVRSL